jgi:endonuclease G
VQNKQRKLAFYTATNIDGKSWKVLVKKEGGFRKEEAIAENEQTGDELYDFHQSQTNNDFDKGHITKLHDPQWGSEEAIRQAAADTMKFVNCLPQHHRLNRGAWKSLEDYIIKKFTTKSGENGSKISLFAGPLFLPNDPFYHHKINGEAVQIPCYFWKLVVYPNKRNQLSAVGFLMSQRNLLLKQGFVVEKKREVKEIQRLEDDFFTDFSSGKPYQVSIDFLEKVTGFRFGVSTLHQPYTKIEPTEVIYQRVQVPVKEALNRSPFHLDRPLNFHLEGVAL